MISFRPEILLPKEFHFRALNNTGAKKVIYSVFKQATSAKGGPLFLCPNCLLPSLGVYYERAIVSVVRKHPTSHFSVH